MKEFFKKNGGKILTGGAIVTWFAAMGGAIASLIRSDKRQLKYYQKVDEIQREELSYWKNLNGKES